jgi:hypothetical protein
MAVNIDKVQAITLIGLLIGFLYVDQISDMIGHSLDTLPVRFAALFIILGSVYLDRYVSLAVFLLVLAVYIQHHQNDISGLSLAAKRRGALNPYEIPEAIVRLEDGGHASEDYETADYTPQKEDQENEFSPAGPSINEKHVLPTETLGSKSQDLFGEDMRNAEGLAEGNRNGSAE